MLSIQYKIKDEGIDISLTDGEVGGVNMFIKKADFENIDKNLDNLCSTLEDYINKNYVSVNKNKSKPDVRWVGLKG